MVRYSVEQKTRKYVKWYKFLSFSRSFSNKYRKQLLDRDYIIFKLPLKSGP